MGREELWAQWEREKPRAEDAIWDCAPGYELIPEVDVPLNHSWFLDGTHSCPPMDPFSVYEYWARGCGHGLKFINSFFSLPRSYGTEGRVREGAIYWAFYVVRDEKEIREREARFREALRPFLEDFDGIWEKHKHELQSMYQKLLSFNPREARNIDYIHLHWDCIESIFRVWEIHFQGMQSSYSAWILLEEECKRRFGLDDKSEDFQDMLRGFDNEVYRVDREMWELAKTAVDMGLSDVFKEKSAEELTSALQLSDRGKEWWQKFMNFLDVRGWRSISSISIADPYWLEQPSTPLRKIKDLIIKGEAMRKDYILDEKRKEFSAKREAAINKLLEKVPDADKAWFRSLINLAQRASSYSEEHDLLCEMTHFAVLRRSYLHIGEWLAKNGCIDRPEDVMFLISPEIEMCLLVPQRNDMRWITRRRRAQWEQWRARFAKEGEFRPPVYTDRSNIQEAIALDLLPTLDPIFIKIVVGELPSVSAEEIGADIVGICGCPGVAEGHARVVMQYMDLDQLQPGEILVCPQTSPEWTTAFSIAAGVIADRGGTLSHAAIIGREYGVPTIVNTFVACEKIKTGQRIRMDASKGAVYILDKEQ